MSLNPDLVHATFSSKDPGHAHILADHADEQGHPELATAFRNEQKSARPMPWYDDDWGTYRGDYDYPARRYYPSDMLEERPEPPQEHLKRIQKKGKQLAPGIFILPGSEGFGPGSRNSAARWDQGFHVYDLRGLDHEHEQDEDGLYHFDHSQAVPDSETFDSAMDYNAALEEYFGGRGKPRFFKYKGAQGLKLSRDDQTALVHHALDTKDFGILADYFDERGKPVLAGILRRHRYDPNGTDPQPEMWDDRYHEVPNPYSQHYFDSSITSPTQHLAWVRKQPALAPDVHLVKEKNGYHLYDLRKAPPEDHDLDYNADNAVANWLEGDGIPSHFFPSKTEKLDLARFPQDEPTPEFTALAEQIKKPGNKLAELVLADHLDERGHPLLAALIRRSHQIRIRKGRDWWNHLYHNNRENSFYEIPNQKYSEIPGKLSIGRSMYLGNGAERPQYPYATYRIGKRAFTAPMTHEEVKELWRTYKPDDHPVSENHFESLNPKTKQGTDPRLNLARPGVIFEANSRQQKVRRYLAAKIAKEALLKLEDLKDARTNTQANVIQTYGHDNDPHGVEFAAAWYGLLSRSPQLTAFHVHDGGPDTYHQWRTGVNPDKVLDAAGKMGLNAVVTSDGQVSILDQGNQRVEPIQKLQEVSYAHAPSAEAGTARTFSGRDAYRSTVQRYSQGATPAKPEARPGTAA